jgi:hypothetical protein
MTYITKESYVFEDGKQLLFAVNSVVAQKCAKALELYDLLAEHFLPKPDFTEFDSFVGIESSWILKLGYDSKQKRMLVVMLSGDKEKTLVYQDVPPQVFVRVLKPDAEFGFSVGAAYNKLLRGQYEVEE